MKIMHITARQNSLRTYCKRTFLKCGDDVGMCYSGDEYTPGPLHPGEVWCRECLDSDEYQEKDALWMLSELP